MRKLIFIFVVLAGFLACPVLSFAQNEAESNGAAPSRVAELAGWRGSVGLGIGTEKVTALACDFGYQLGRFGGLYSEFDLRLSLDDIMSAAVGVIPEFHISGHQLQFSIGAGVGYYYRSEVGFEEGQDPAAYYRFGNRKWRIRSYVHAFEVKPRLALDIFGKNGFVIGFVAELPIHLGTEKWYKTSYLALHDWNGNIMFRQRKTRGSNDYNEVEFAFFLRLGFKLFD